MRQVHVSDNVIRRLPRYLRKLDELLAAGTERISSNELGHMMGLTPSQIRQDFSCFGEFGQQGYGYNIANLHRQVSSILGMDRDYRAIMLGTGKIGQALLGHLDFGAYGIRVEAAFDNDSTIIGDTLSGIPVFDALELPAYCAAHPVQIAILCVPQDSAQAAAKELISLGVRAIWNFTNCVLDIPEDSGVIQESIFFSDSLLAMSYYLSCQFDEEVRKQERAV